MPVAQQFKTQLVKFNLHLMVGVIIDQTDKIRRLHHIIADDAANGISRAFVLDSDVIMCLVESIVNFERWPRSGRTRGEVELIDFQMQAEK